MDKAKFENMKIYASQVQMLTDEQYKRCFALLDSQRRERVNGLKHDKERARSVYAGLLLRRAYIDEGFGASAWERVQVRQGKYGKPYLADCGSFFYSLSHSGEWVICAVDNTELGADIQKIGALKMAVAKRFYADEEYSRLMECEPDKDKQTVELYRMWAAKESCVKLTGRGIGAGISGCVTDRSYSYITDAGGSGRFYTRLYESISGYEVCVCSARGDFPENIIISDVLNNG